MSTISSLPGGLSDPNEFEPCPQPGPISGVVYADALDDVDRRCARILELERELAAQKMDYRLLAGALAAASDDKIVMQGFLKKKTPSIVVNRDYDRRWFILQGRMLRYYEEKGTIAMDDETMLEEAAKDPVAFTLSHPKAHRKFELKCDSAMEKARWMAAIKGEPLPVEEEVEADLATLEQEEEAERNAIEAHGTNRDGVLQQWFESETLVMDQRMKDLKKARSFALQLLATDEKLTNANKRIAELEELLANETRRKDYARETGSENAAAAGDLRLLAVYQATWRRFVAKQLKERNEAKVAQLQQEKFDLSGRLAFAQDHGERFMDGQKLCKRVILDLQEDVKRLEDQSFWLHFSNKYLFQHLEERNALLTADMQRTISSLTDHRDRLRNELDETIADLLDTRERLRVKTNLAEQQDVALAEGAGRYEIASTAQFEAFHLQASSVNAATGQAAGGRVLASMDGWNGCGGEVWRRVYLWSDAGKGTLNYAHRDRRWGEYETISLVSVLCVEVESFYEYPPPPGVPGFEHLGFYIEMSDGRKHRFCARDSVERSEWLDSLRGLVLAVCYMSPRRTYSHHGGSSSGSPTAPRPALQGGSPWAAVPGGGSPRGAAADTVKPGSVRRTRASVARPATPGEYGYPHPDMEHDMAASPSSPRRVVVIPAA